jgi:geranylgeranyl pyrophosphate synthase
MITDTLQYRSLLRDELQTVRDLMLAECANIPSAIQQPIKRLIDGGGKHLRPALVLLYAHMCGADRQKALLAAAGVEMLHTATLVHDDLIDGARIRRGVETLNIQWSTTATILSGDAMFALAAKLIARTSDSTLALRFAETLESICAGELHQMLSRDGGTLPSVDAYQQRIFAKTASLFALCTETGPILAAQGQPAVDDARRFGRLLGEAFQITDDVLDIMGTAESLGKPVGSDLRQGLATLPVINYGQAFPDDRRLRTVLQHEADDGTMQALIDDIRASGAADRAMALADSQIALAGPLLSRYADTEYRQAVEEIARFSVWRRY